MIIFTAALIVIFFTLIWLAIEGKLTPREDWTAIHPVTGKYERFNRKRKREEL